MKGKIKNKEYNGEQLDKLYGVYERLYESKLNFDKRFKQVEHLHNQLYNHSKEYNASNVDVLKQMLEDNVFELATFNSILFEYRNMANYYIDKCIK